MGLVKNIFIIALISSFFPTPGYLYMQVILAVIQFIVLSYNLFSKNINKNHIFNKYTIFLTILFFYAFLSLFWVKDVGRWIIYVGSFFVGWIHSFSISALFKEKKIMSQLVKIILIAIFIQNLVGWFEITTGLYFFTDNISNIAYSRIMSRPLSFFKNVNDYATFLLFGLSFLVSWQPRQDKFQNISNNIPMVFRLVMIVSTTFLIFFTQSRGIILSMIILFIYYLFINVRDPVKRVLTVNIFVVSALLLGSILLILYGSFSLDQLDSSDSDRIFLLLNGFEYLKDTFFFGIGAGSIPYYLENFQYFDVSHLRNIHSWWMEFLVMYGLFFFLVYVVYYVYITIKSHFYAIKQANIFLRFTATWSISFIIGSMISSSLFSTIWVFLIHNLMFVAIESQSENNIII